MRWERFFSNEPRLWRHVDQQEDELHSVQGSLDSVRSRVKNHNEQIAALWEENQGLKTCLVGLARVLVAKKLVTIEEMNAMAAELEREQARPAPAQSYESAVVGEIAEGEKED